MTKYLVLSSALAITACTGVSRNSKDSHVLASAALTARDGSRCNSVDKSQAVETVGPALATIHTYIPAPQGASHITRLK
jgi:hypothetical protein